MDITGGEPELYRGLLKPAWRWLRWIECSAASERACPIWGAIYGLFGWPCREEERNSFALVVTPSRLVYAQTLYKGGMCCRQAQRIEVPLDDVQRVVVKNTDDCCCGCCGDEVQIWMAPKEGKDGVKSGCACCCKPPPYWPVRCLRDPAALSDAATRAKANRERALAAPSPAFVLAGAGLGGRPQQHIGMAKGM